MVESATWICLSILFILIIILAILMISLRLFYPPTKLHQNVECLADVLAMIAGSDELLDLVGRQSITDLKRTNDIETSLGWFTDRRGTVRWGVEVVGALGVVWGHRGKV